MFDEGASDEEVQKILNQIRDDTQGDLHKMQGQWLFAKGTHKKVLGFMIFDLGQGVADTNRQLS